MNKKQTTAVATVPKLDIFQKIAAQFALEPRNLVSMLKATVFPTINSMDHIAAALVLCSEFNLNPFLRHVHLFESNGRVVPCVGVDGWIRIAQDKGLKRYTFDITDDDNGKPTTVLARGWKEGSDEPYEITEYFEECYRNTTPWNQMPRRMLRHKGLTQLVRIMYGIGGVPDEDEARDILAAEFEDLGNATVTGTDATREAMAASLAGPDPEPVAEEPATATASEEPAPEKEGNRGGLLNPASAASPID